MNMYLHELKAYRKSIIIWSVCIFLLVFSSISKFEGFTTSGQDVSAIFDQMPKALKAIFGIGTLDVSKASGYYGIIFNYMILMSAIHAVLLGANIIAKEEQEKTAEFLLVKPVSRTKIIVSKLLAALTNLVVFNLVVFASGVYFVNKFSNGDLAMSDIVTLSLGLILIQLIFLSIGAVVAAVNKQSRSAGSIATGVMLFTYLISMVIMMNDKLNFLKYFTPFQYFDVGTVFENDGLQLTYILISLLLILGCFGATFYFYNKRDLKV